MTKTRREILSTLAAGSLAFSGCTALQSPPPGVAIEEISITNLSSEEQKIEYQVDRGDQVAIDTSVTLNAEKSDSNGEDERYYADKIVEHEELYERAVYTMRCRLAGDDEWHLEFTWDGESYTCLKLSIDVSERESMAVSSGEVPPSRCSALTLTEA